MSTSSRCNSDYSLTTIIIRIFVGFLVLPAFLTSSHPVSDPGSFSLTKVAHFPFYSKLSNPCGVSGGSATGAGAMDETAFTTDFLLAMSTAINLTMDALEELESANRASLSCSGVFLDSLPKTPAMKTMNELKLMSQSYKSAVFLIAHLHIVRIDREVVGETNEVRDEDLGNEEDDDQGLDFLCGREPSNYVALVQELTRRMENLLCTVVTGANLEQRASFRRPLQHLELTKIFRYHNSCSALQARDCVVLQETRQFLQKLRTKYKKLIFQKMFETRLFAQRRGIIQVDDSLNQL